MPRTPEQLIEVATRHASHLERVKSHDVRAYETFLTRMADQVRARLSKADGLTDYTLERLKRLQGKIADDLSEIASSASGELRNQIRQIAQYEAGFEAKSLGQVVKHDFAVPSVTQLNAAVFATPLASIKGADQGKMLAAFIKSWSEATIDRVQGAVVAGYYQGQTNMEIMRGIIGSKKARYGDGEFARVWRNLETVVRTSLQHAASQARQATWDANSDIVKQVMWLSTLDTRTSTICQALDRTVYPLDSGPRPPAHPNCRSTTVAVLDSRFAMLDDDATRAARDPETGQVEFTDAKETYYSWLKRQPADVQDSIIGPSRGKLLRDGGITSDRFAELQLGRNFEPMTLARMRELEPTAFQRAGI